MSRIAILILATVCLSVGGCRYRLQALKPPQFDPEKNAAAALDLYDVNGDQKIDKQELKASPPLEAVMGQLDTNKDNAVDAEELATLIQEKWLDAKGGIIIVGVKVLLNKQPLDGATVTFEPAPFLADVLHPATGLTDYDGFTPMELAEEHRPHENARSGVAPGVYRVRISKVVNGKEFLPKKYNEETTLGVEVAVRAAYMPGSAVFELRK